jgi:AcrR family transcriptional regulator
VRRKTNTRKKREPRKPGRPRAEQSNHRERLLDAAVACFAADGVAATSLRGIALQAGVTPALVNYYFGSKEQLLDAFIAERISPVVQVLREGLLAAGDEPRAVLAAFVRGMVDGIHARRGRERFGRDGIEDALELDAADALCCLVEHVIELPVHAEHLV